jgi:SAM-dependent methyltransferase
MAECSACGVAFLFPQPTDEVLARHYDEAYYGKGRKKFLAPVEAGIRALTWMKWRSVRGVLSPGARMLDIGCGRGTLIRMARDAGYEAYGIERASPEEHPVPNVFYKDLPECGFPDGHFQLVTIWHVLEHLRDPLTTLAEIRRILAPGGWLSVAVPNFGGAQAQASGALWFHLDLPRHLWHFRRRSLEAMLAKSGFRAARCSTLSFEYDWYGTLQSWMNRACSDGNRLYSLLKGQAAAKARPPLTPQTEL